MRKLRVDLEELVHEATWNDTMDIAPFRYFDTQCGRVVWVERELAQALEDGEDLSDYEGDEEVEIARQVADEDDTRFVCLPERWPDENFQLMLDFVNEVTEGKVKDALAEALRMRKPFRRFKDALSEFPEVREQYFQFEAACHRLWITNWLNDLGIEPIDTKREEP